MTGILGSAVLDVAIGMAFLYLLLAVFCTTANEWVAGILKKRSKMLEKALQQMLANQAAVTTAPTAVPDAPTPAAQQIATFAQQFYQHPIIANMMRHVDGKVGHFSYLPARSFSTVVMDLI